MYINSRNIYTYLNSKDRSSNINRILYNMKILKITANARSTFWYWFRWKKFCQELLKKSWKLKNYLVYLIDRNMTIILSMRTLSK